MKISEEVKVDNLVKEFEDMASRGTLLTGRTNITQEDLLVQIIGTIVKVAMKEK